MKRDNRSIVTEMKWRRNNIALGEAVGNIKEFEQQVLLL